jgi:hypothetical protein
MYSPKIVILFLIFLAGLYFYVEYGSKPKKIEGLTTINSELRCPNILIQKDAKYYLYNSNIDEAPGVNPIIFNNLEEYTKFLEWQRGAGIRCPVLYVQNTYDAQGNRVYKIRPSVSEPQGGLPSTTTTNTDAAIDTTNINTDTNDNSNILLVDANRNNMPYNTNSVAGFDQSSYYVGTTTPLDSIGSNANLLYTNDVKNNKNSDIIGKSANPMDPNWGGQDFTQTLVDTGFYKDNEVNILNP